MTSENCDKWFYALLFALFIILAGLVMIFRYFLQLSRDGVSLRKNDELHEQKHKHNELRIKELEKNNGSEQRQINELKEEIEKVKKIKQNDKSRRN